MSSLNQYKDAKEVTSFEIGGFKFFKDLIDGYITHILAIFNLMIDERKVSLTTKFFEVFYQNKVNLWTEDNTAKLDFSDLIEPKTFFDSDWDKDSKLLEYTFPKLQTLYEDYWKTYIKTCKSDVLNPDDQFKWFLMQIFNIWGNNFYNKQLCITLLARVNNEIGEFSRSIDRTLLMANEQEELFYHFIFENARKFRYTSRQLTKWISGYYLTQNDQQIAKEDSKKIELPRLNEVFNNLHQLLFEIFYALTRKWTVQKSNSGELELRHFDEDILNIFIQDVCRNLKFYDELIKFILSNKQYLFWQLKIKPLDLSQSAMSKFDPHNIQELVGENVVKTFKLIFNVLKRMTEKNEKTQRVMWKYKTLFVMEELGSQPQIGELDLVLKILESKEMIKKAKDFTELVDSLHKRW
jgi:hypothetical protein